MSVSSPLEDLDNDMVNMFKYGDKEVYTRLYHKYAPAVLGVLTRTTGDQRVAEECLHDVFSLVWSKRLEYNPEKERLFTWMMKLVKEQIACIPAERKAQFADQVREEIDMVYAMDIRTWLQDRQRELGDNFAAGVDVTIKEAIRLIYFESCSFAGAAEKSEMSVEMLREKMIKTIKQIKGSLLA